MVKKERTRTKDNTSDSFIEDLKNELEEREKIIIKQELELTDLRITVEQKEEVIKSCQDHIKSLNQHLETKHEMIEILRDIIYKKFGINYFKTSQLHQEFVKPTEEKVRLLIEDNHKQKIFINEFRSSIIFPLYRLSHSFGETKIGRFLQKLLK